MPRAQSAAAIIFLPEGWILVSSTAWDPVPTRTLFPSRNCAGLQVGDVRPEPDGFEFDPLSVQDVVQAPGSGVTPRARLPIASAGCFQSSRPSSMVSLGASETSPACGCGSRLPCFDGGQRLCEQHGPAVGQPLQQRPGGVVRANAFGQRPEDRAGVQAFFQQEGDGAGDVVAGHNGPLYGGSAAPGGKEGEMQVDPAMRGNIQGGARNQSAIGHDGGHVRLGCGDLRRHGVVNAGGVDDVDAQLGGAGGNGRRRQHPFAPNRRVRTGQDRNDVKAGLDQGVQGRDGDGGSAGKKYPHAVAPPPKLDPPEPAPKLAPPKLDPTVLARFAVVRSVMAS